MAPNADFLANFRFGVIFLAPGNPKPLNPLDWLFLANFRENGLLGQDGSKMAIFSLKMLRFLANFWVWVIFGHFWPLGTLNPLTL